MARHDDGGLRGVDAHGGELAGLVYAELFFFAQGLETCHKG